MRKYLLTFNGDFYIVRKRNFRIMCCDCGLVHRYNHFIEKIGKRQVIVAQVFRDERATAAARRGKRYRK